MGLFTEGKRTAWSSREFADTAPPHRLRPVLHQQRQDPLRESLAAMLEELHGMQRKLGTNDRISASRRYNHGPSQRRCRRRLDWSTLGSRAGCSNHVHRSRFADYGLGRGWLSGRMGHSICYLAVDIWVRQVAMMLDRGPGLIYGFRRGRRVSVRGIPWLWQ